MDKSDLNLKDALLKKTRALPASAQTVYSAGIDLGAVSDRGVFAADCEVLITAPALDGYQLDDAQTMKYFLQDSADDSSYATIMADVLVQTGDYDEDLSSSGETAAAATVRLRLPSTCRRYIRLGITGSGSDDASGETATMELVF